MCALARTCVCPASSIRLGTPKAGDHISYLPSICSTHSHQTTHTWFASFERSQSPEEERKQPPRFFAEALWEWAHHSWVSVVSCGHTPETWWPGVSEEGPGRPEFLAAPLQLCIKPRFFGDLFGVSEQSYSLDLRLRLKPPGASRKVRQWRMIKRGPFCPEPAPSPLLGRSLRPEPQLHYTVTLHARRGALIIHTNLQVKCCVKNRNAIVYNKIKNIKSPNPKASIDRVSCHLEEQTSHCTGRKKNLLCWFPPLPLFNHQPPSVSLERTLQVQVCLQPVLPLPHPDLTSLPTVGSPRTQSASDGIPEAVWK